jgi:hypothetical protein
VGAFNSESIVDYAGKNQLLSEEEIVYAIQTYRCNLEIFYEYSGIKHPSNKE